MSLPLTAGAQRALDRAAQIARQVGAADVEAVHLLWGLLLDESRAAAQLASQGLTAERLEELHPLEEKGDRSLFSDAPRISPHVEDAVYVARRKAIGLGAGEVGSEHLLLGLVEIDSPVRSVLAGHGLTPEAAAATPPALPPLAPSEHPWAEPPVTDLTDAYRILDAAANRLREGLRVLEDFVRFALDDRHLTERLKTWRHEFTAALRLLNAPALLAARDTEADVGTSVHTPQERHRGSLADVTQAACKRAQEAARTLEECGKLVDRDFAATLGRLRYELYTLEKAILRTHTARERLAECRLYLLVTEELCPHGSGPMLKAALAGGVDIVQVREKRMPDRELLAHARRVREWTRNAGVLFLMNDRPDLAVLADADGVHVGQEELTVRDARRIVGPDRLIGVSTHTIEQARQAVLDGADYLGVGPVYPSGTKSFTEFAGLDFVRQVAAEIRLPAFAIGGIDPENLTPVLQAGATRIALSGALCCAEEPRDVASQLRLALKR